MSNFGYDGESLHALHAHLAEMQSHVTQLQHQISLQQQQTVQTVQGFQAAPARQAPPTDWLSGPVADIRAQLGSGQQFPAVLARYDSQGTQAFLQTDIQAAPSQAVHAHAAPVQAAIAPVRPVLASPAPVVSGSGAVPLPAYPLQVEEAPLDLDVFSIHPTGTCGGAAQPTAVRGMLRAPQIDRFERGDDVHHWMSGLRLHAQQGLYTDEHLIAAALLACGPDARRALQNYAVDRRPGEALLDTFERQLMLEFASPADKERARLVLDTLRCEGGESVDSLARRVRAARVVLGSDAAVLFPEALLVRKFLDALPANISSHMRLALAEGRLSGRFDEIVRQARTVEAVFARPPASTPRVTAVFDSSTANSQPQPVPGLDPRVVYGMMQGLQEQLQSLGQQVQALTAQQTMLPFAQLAAAAAQAATPAPPAGGLFAPSPPPLVRQAQGPAGLAGPAGRGRGRQGVRCFHCRQFGHFPRECPNIPPPGFGAGRGNHAMSGNA